MQYRIELPKRVQKELDHVDLPTRERVLLTLFALQKDPLLGKALKAKFEGLRSVRVWPYRVIYEIQKKDRVILIIKIGRRKDVYR